MRRIKILFVLLLALSLSGCIQKYNFTEEKSEAVAECMAGLLLKYDSNYDERLLPKEELIDTSDDTFTSEENNSKTASEKETQTGDEDIAAAVPGTEEEYTLSQVIGQKDCNIWYTGYKLFDSYPEDTTNTSFVLTSSQSKYQLLVVSFNVKNNSKNDIDLNLIDSDITYLLDINDGTNYRPLLTFLENDLQYIDISIEGGKSEDAVLVFEIAKDVDMTDVKLIVSKEDKSDIINLK